MEQQSVDLDTGKTPDQLADDIEKLLKIDMLKLGEELQRGPKIHSELQKLFRVEARLLRKWVVTQTKVINQRTKYYDGKMPGEHYAKHPLPEQIMTKESIKRYLAVDPHIIQAADIVADIEQKVKMLEDAMKRATSRGYDIKTMLDWVKFNAGAY